MPDQTRGYACRIDIAADIQQVWQGLIDPARLSQWLAPGARVDARDGGSYTMRFDGDLAREAHIDVCTPPRRLRLIYMPLADLPDNEAVIVDDFLIDRDEAASRASGAPASVLRLLGSGVPDTREWDQTYLRLRTAWERLLPRLKVLLERAAGGAKR